MAEKPEHIVVQDLTMSYGEEIIQQDLNFTVRHGDIFIIMGGSGCGKSTLLRHMIGLHRPTRGDILFEGKSLWQAAPREQEEIKRGFGVLFQSGALWSSLTIAENVALPLEEYTRLRPRDIRDVVALKLALVRLSGFENHYPNELSGGMQKRAGLARAMALDPAILFFDEPSAGLDPLNSCLLDDLILELRDSLGATVVVVTHELASIFGIGDNSVFLDAETKTMIASGHPRTLLAESQDPRVQSFLRRGCEEERGEILRTPDQPGPVPTGGCPPRSGSSS